MSTISNQLVVFRGTTEECLFALTKEFPGIEERKMLAQLMQVSYDSTFTVWMRNNRFVSGGAILTRVRAVLELFGYHCVEWNELNPSLHTVALSLGLGICSVEEAVQAFGYTNSNQVYRLVLGRQSNASPDRDVLIRVYARSLELTLQEKIASIYSELEENNRKLWRALPSNKDLKQKVLQGPVEHTHQDCDGHFVDTDLEAVFVAQVQALLPLARYLNSANVSPDTRRTVRKRLGHGALGELNNLLEALSSEQHRTHWLEGQREERIVR